MQAVAERRPVCGVLVDPGQFFLDLDEPRCCDLDERQAGAPHRGGGRAHLRLVPPVPTSAVANVQASPLVLLVALVVAVLMVCVVGLNVANAVPRHPSAVPVVAGRPYVVQPGDSLWSIARSLQSTGDVRMLVHQLEQTNGVVNVDAGSTIMVP